MRSVFFMATVLLLAMVLPAVCGVEGIVLQTMDGARVSVDSLMAEGPVVIDFWATWCRPCRVEMPRLQKIYEELADRKVHFAAVSLDTRQSKSRVEAYMEKNALSIPVYCDADGKLARMFKVMAIPTTILIDQNGDIAYQTRGYRPGDEILLKKQIETLIDRRDLGDGSRKSAE
jgi:thiol-disulfide isomerase/thioredoxin